MVVASAASNRGEYLRRPDLGRRPAQVVVPSPDEHEVAIIAVDGLSPRAVQEQLGGSVDLQNDVWLIPVEGSGNPPSPNR